jgi:hypothetical protein
VKQAIYMPLALQRGLWHNTSGMRRWLFFLLAIAIGAVIGIFYGWRINPVEYSDTVPDKLRQDYKTDYVLMVAEAFSKDQDMALAVERLTFLGGKSPDGVVIEAIKFAEEEGYRSTDMALMNDLADEMEFFQKVLETPEQ